MLLLLSGIISNFDETNPQSLLALGDGKLPLCAMRSLALQSVLALPLAVAPFSLLSFLLGASGLV